MKSPDYVQQKALSLDALAGWRAARARDGQRVAVVCGAFDILHPGNLWALHEAARQADAVCVLLPAPDPGSSAASNSACQHSVAERAAVLSHLRLVQAVSGVAPGAEDAASRHLAPLTFVDCPQLSSPGKLPEALREAAADRLDLPRIPGCSTAEIRAAIREHRTPVSAILPPGRSWGEASALPPLAARQGSTVTVNGCFDILHIGHLRFLADARTMGDELILLINSDASVRRYKGPTRPVFPAEFRRAALLALESVSEVHVFDGDTPLDLLARVRPDVHVKGGSYEEERTREERQLLESWGGRLAFCPMVGAHSTSALIRKVMD